MSFIDMEITRRQFEDRYINVGRAMLGTLADICCVDFDQAERWADEIDREAGILIAADSSVAGGIEGAGALTPGRLWGWLARRRSDREHREHLSPHGRRRRDFILCQAEWGRQHRLGGKMTRQKIIRDANGAVINIGDWDFMIELAYDEESEQDVEIVHNPLPPGAYEDEADIVTLADGGLRAITEDGE